MESLTDGMNTIDKGGDEKLYSRCDPARLRLNGLAGLEGLIEYDQAE